MLLKRYKSERPDCKFAGHTDYRMTLRYINGQITDANRRATEALNWGIQTTSDHFSANEKTS